MATVTGVFPVIGRIRMACPATGPVFSLEGKIAVMVERRRSPSIRAMALATAGLAPVDIVAGLVITVAARAVGRLFRIQHTVVEKHRRPPLGVMALRTPAGIAAVQGIIWLLPFVAGIAVVAKRRGDRFVPERPDRLPVISPLVIGMALDA